MQLRGEFNATKKMLNMEWNMMLINFFIYSFYFYFILR